MSNKADAGWARFGLTRNPFPSRAQPIWDVMVNQEAVTHRFYTDLRAFLDDRATTTLFFTGGNRVGKTHFLEHHRVSLRRLAVERGLVLPVALVNAQLADFPMLLRDVVRQIEEEVRAQTGESLLRIPGAAERLSSLPVGGDLRTAMERARAQPAHAVLFHQWLAGQRLRATQRQELGVRASLEGLGPLLQCVASLVRFLSSDRGEPRTPGVLVFVDEFELVWHARSDRRDNFLLGLRALIDECASGGLFLCVAMATGVSFASVGGVERAYPALYQRLVGARPIPALVEVTGVLSAIEHAEKFVQHGRTVGGLGMERPPPVLTREEIEQIFVRRSANRGSVPQGDLFDALHTAAQEKVRPPS